MNELNCPIHYGACMLKGSVDPLNRPQVYSDFCRLGLQSLIELEDVVHPWKVREFHNEFLMTGVNSPATWGNEVRVTFAVNQTPYNKSTAEFGRLMGIYPDEDDLLFFTNSLDFTYELVDDGGEELDDLLSEIVKPSKVDKCIRNGKVKISDLKENLMVYYQIIRENVTCRDLQNRMPGQPRTDKVMVIEALMLSWILNHKNFDMGYIMASIIQEAKVVHPTAPLPYGMRLTKLFRRLDVMPSEDEDPPIILARKPLV